MQYTITLSEEAVGYLAALVEIDQGQHTSEAVLKELTEALGQEHPYARACREAATRQGLDPVMARLRAEGLPYELEQTGGFTMVVTVPVERGTVTITKDGDGERDYIAGYWPGEAWHQGLGPEDGPNAVQSVDSTDLTLDEVVALTRGLGPRAGSRVYLVGLPVAVTVHDNGTVAYEVDTAEAGKAIRESEPPDDEAQQPYYTEEVVMADAQRAEADHARRRSL